MPLPLVWLVCYFSVKIVTVRGAISFGFGLVSHVHSFCGALCGLPH